MPGPRNGGHRADRACSMRRARNARSWSSVTAPKCAFTAPYTTAPARPRREISTWPPLAEQVFSVPRHADGPAALLAPVPKVAPFFLYATSFAGWRDRREYFSAAIRRPAHSVLHPDQGADTSSKNDREFVHRRRQRAVQPTPGPPWSARRQRSDRHQPSPDTRCRGAPARAKDRTSR